MHKKGAELNELKQQRKMAKFWKQAKQHGSIIHSKPQVVQCKGLAEHFKNHFNPNHSNLSVPHEIENVPDYIQVLQNHNLDMNNSPAR